MSRITLYDITQIPSVIKNSPVYKELIGESYGMPIPIPDEYYFSNFENLFTHELNQILNIMRYWDINPLPYEVIDYVYKNRDLLITLHIELKNYFHEINVIINTEADELCDEAARMGSLNLLRVAHENGCLWEESVCSRAAVNGNLDCLIYAYENSAGLDEYIYWDTMKAGHRDCFKYVASLCGLNYELNHMYEVRGNPGSPCSDH